MEKKTRIGIDPTVFDAAVELAKRSFDPIVTGDEAHDLAEAWQRAYEDWASDIDAARAKETS